MKFDVEILKKIYCSEKYNKPSKIIMVLKIYEVETEKRIAIVQRKNFFEEIIYIL